MEQSPSWEANRSSIVKKFPAFYGTRRFITAFTRACQLFLWWIRSVHSMPPIKLSSHICIDMPSSLFLKFSTQWRWDVSFMFWLHHPRGKIPLYSFSRWLGQPQDQSGWFGNEINFLSLLGMEPQFLSFPACGIVTVSAEQSQLLLMLQMGCVKLTLSSPA
jgi:hypothetical protein